jgi:hypothetical protein
MAEHRIEIGVILARRAHAGRWGGYAWAPHAVLPAAPELAAWTALGARGGQEIFYAGAFELALHPGATAHYRDNLNAQRPSVWVLIAPADESCAVVGVTADPYEGEAMTEGYGNVVDAVPMPDGVRAEIASFVAAHHVEQPFFKRERERVDTETLGTAPAGARRGSRR